MKVPFLDLRPNKELRQELDEAYSAVMQSGRFIGGEQVDAFEKEWASYIGAKYCVSCGNGFDALQLSLRAYDICDAHTVAVPSRTCSPTWMAVREVRANIYPVDDAQDFYDRGDAFIPVHLYGDPVRIKSDVLIIEDAAQAHGSQYPDGTRVGSKNTTAWSFYPTKNLGCYGDGGAVTTNDLDIAMDIYRMRDYGGSGMRRGINSRLDNLQAAFLRVKLRHLDEWNARRSAIAWKYKLLIHWGNTLYVHDTHAKGLGNYHQFVVETPKRDELAEHLRRNDIETMVHYKTPPHQRPYFLYLRNRCPRADKWSATVLSLPIAPHLTDEQVEYVISVVNGWIDNAN